MISLQKLVQYKKGRIYKRKKNRSPILQKNPQKRAVCLKLFIKTPRKPNSAKRKVARIVIPSLGKKTTIAIPGPHPHRLQPHSKVLIRGGNVRDIPGVRYRAIMGKLDLHVWVGRKTRRSFYGVKKN